MSLKITPLSVQSVTILLNPNTETTFIATSETRLEQNYNLKQQTTFEEPFVFSHNNLQSCLISLQSWMQVSHYLITYKWISRRMTSSKVIKFWCFIFQKSWTLSMSKNKKTLDDYYIKNSGIKTRNKMHYVQSLAKKKYIYIYIYLYICERVKETSEFQIILCLYHLKEFESTYSLNLLTLFIKF